MGFFSKGLKNEFETAVVNEPSVFEPLKFYCISPDWTDTPVDKSMFSVLIVCGGDTSFGEERERSAKSSRSPDI